MTLNTMNLPRPDGTVDPARVMEAFAGVMSDYMAGGGAVQKAQTVGAPVGPYVHGPGGLFGVRGLSRGIISTHTQITGSLAERIPVNPSPANEINPLYPYITGFIRSDQQEKDGVCDDPEEAGQFKTCIQTTVFGRKEFKTRQVEINHIGQRINRGEFMDLNLLNSPLVNQMAGIMRQTFALSNQNAALAGREMLMRFIEVGVAFQRWYCPQVYTGNPANSSAGGGYKEFMGLDLLISRTKVDAIAGTACPSLYSDVKDFNYQDVGGSAQSPDIVRVIQTIFLILKTKARQQNLAPVQFAMAMRSQLFYELTRVWPTLYYTEGGLFTNANASGAMRINDAVAVDFRNEMRNGEFLLVDNVRIPVILDDCIAEETAADNAAIPIGGYSSDIYIVPMTARGGTIRTLFWDYYDYTKDVIPAVADARMPGWFWSDGGVFLWGLKAPDNWCLEHIAKTEPRLILRTPQLAGRLQNVVYVPLQHTDDPLPSSEYHVNGGISTGYPFASPYSEYNLSGPGPGA